MAGIWDQLASHLQQGQTHANAARAHLGAVAQMASMAAHSAPQPMSGLAIKPMPTAGVGVLPGQLRPNPLGEGIRQPTKKRDPWLQLLKR